jgi:undecaprenyl-diphosphatase
VKLATGWRQEENRTYLGKLAVAFLTSVILGLVAKKFGIALPETVTPVAWALIIGGVSMIAAESFAARRKDRVVVTWAAAVVVGIAQIVAGVLPGTSRSDAAIFAVMLVGTSDRAAATEFAFLVGIPTVYAASVYQLHGQFNCSVTEDRSALAAAFLASLLTAFGSVAWLLRYIRSHRFTAFAVYRILLGSALLGLSI